MAGSAVAGPPEDGLVFRAAGFFEAEASQGGQCEIPGIDSGVPVSSDAIGLWNTFGSPTTSYPDNICQGWMEVMNVMTSQGISVERVDFRLRIAGARRFRQFVPTRNGFPTACRHLRRPSIFTGAYLFPFGTDPDFGNTGSGVGHVAFVNLLPMVDAQVIGCLRAQYAALPSDVYTAFPLVITAVARGITDTGESVRTNPIRFTLNLMHFCGNGRIEPGEQCDPNAPDTCGIGPCDTSNNTCRGDDTVFCQTDADCGGQCIQQGDPMECACLYGGN